MADAGEVDPDLVGPARFKAHAQKREARKLLDDVIMGFGRLPAFIQSKREGPTGIGVFPKGDVDVSPIAVEMAFDEG